VIVLGFWNNLEEQKCQLYRKFARSVPVGVKEREEETSISNGNWGIEVRKPMWQTAFEHRNKRNYPKRSKNPREYHLSSTHLLRNKTYFNKEILRTSAKILLSTFFFIVLWKTYLSGSASKLQAGTATLFSKSFISPSSSDAVSVHILNYNKGKKPLQLPRQYISRYYLAFYFKLRNCTKVTDGRMLIKIQPDATVCRYLFTAKSLYIFRVSTAPIIRCTKNCNRSLRYRSYSV